MNLRLYRQALIQTNLSFSWRFEIPLLAGYIYLGYTCTTGDRSEITEGRATIYVGRVIIFSNKGLGRSLFFYLN